MQYDHTAMTGTSAGGGEHVVGVDIDAAVAVDVLIVGAGPTGLVLALWLTTLGVRVRIIDRTAEPGTTSRALAVHARTLEFYQQIGLAADVVARGRRMNAINLWASGKRVAHAVLGEMGAGISPFPFALIFPQDEHEGLLIDRLKQLGVEVERQTALTAFEETSGGVTATLTLTRGAGSDVAGTPGTARTAGTVEARTETSETCHAAYIAGCDGAHSTVRELLSIGFQGGTYNHLFYVADIEGRGAAMNGELHAALDTSDFLAVFPLKADGHARLIGTVRPEAEARAGHARGGELSWKDVSKRVIERMRLDVDRVNWFSTYRVHHRVADRFRTGRAFLLGDAAHVHSPVGGQGMNTGIGDAVNLAWKLAAVLRHRADASLLDTYEPERIAFARRLVDTTDRAFTVVTSPGRVARAVRLQVVPRVVPLLVKGSAVRRLMFRTVSQTAVNYRDSPLSQGHAGAVHGGDRLPYVPATATATATATANGTLGNGNVGMDNFEPLKSLDWHVHIYGAARPEIENACRKRPSPLALHLFPWTPAAAHAGLQRDALYLVRPDGYIALADPKASVATLNSHLDALQRQDRLA
jgi:2-polyprenyl-6-methoxyphenol hydroxylase-like FAD-dependent oxidoreductase